MRWPRVAVANGDWERRPVLVVEAGPLGRSLHLLFSFLLGCVVAAVAVSLIDTGRVLPAALAAAAVGGMSEMGHSCQFGSPDVSSALPAVRKNWPTTSSAALCPEGQIDYTA